MSEFEKLGYGKDDVFDVIDGFSAYYQIGDIVRYICDCNRESSYFEVLNRKTDIKEICISHVNLKRWKK